MSVKNILFKSARTQIVSFPENASCLAKKMMLMMMRFRRISNPNKTCAASPCEACLAPHLSQVISAIMNQQPITFLLPGFPAKSPNPAKVLGTLPDMAEELSLEFLDKLCKQIQTIYSPGAHVILCSDGRVFNDVVGIHDIDVTNYQRKLLELINEKYFTCLSIFNLDDIYPNLDFTQMRHHLMTQYGESLESLKTAVRKGSQAFNDKENEEVHRQYCGITRFLVEDAMHPGQALSRNALQKTCRERAYIVIQRSRAWSELIRKRFPDAVRLSIHPQTCGDSKLGIRLLEAENWLTPWHGVAVDIEGKFILLKRTQAEELGAQLIFRKNRPSHYKLIDRSTHAKT